MAASKLQTSTANVLLEEKAATLSCEPGETLSVVNGTGTTSDRTKCGMHNIWCFWSLLIYSWFKRSQLYSFIRFK